MKTSRYLLPIMFLSLAASAQADPLQSVAKHLSKKLAALKIKRVAVLTFPYHNGDISSGSSIVSERLTTSMVERGEIEVVERALLDKPMEEIRLGMTGAVDSATTQKLGKVLGVSVIITGTLIDLEGKVTEVNARLIETETGSILAADSTRIDRTWDDLPKPARSVVMADAPKDDEYHLVMSKAIPAGPARRPAPPIYNGPHPGMDGTPLPEGEDALTLTNADLVPVNHRGETDPERIINDFIASDGPPPPYAIRVARRIYHRNPSPEVRGRALLAMGHILERSGRPDQANQAYSQILREFPDAPRLQAEAHQHLSHIASR